MLIKRLSAAGLLAVSALACVAPSASAQSHYSSRVYLGAHGGIDLSRVTFTPGVSQSFLLGGNAGLNFRYIEEKHFGFIVEANWEQRGWKEDFEDLPYSYSRTVNYIQIPFLAHIYFGNRGKFFISGGIGGEFSINPHNSLYLDARFYYGLANILKSGRTEPVRGSNGMTISLSLGYWFRLK